MHSSWMLGLEKIKITLVGLGRKNPFRAEAGLTDTAHDTGLFPF